MRRGGGQGPSGFVTKAGCRGRAGAVGLVMHAVSLQLSHRGRLPLPLRPALHVRPHPALHARPGAGGAGGGAGTSVCGCVWVCGVGQRLARVCVRGGQGWRLEGRGPWVFVTKAGGWVGEVCVGESG